MKKTNAYLIQRALKLEDYISIPWLMMDYELGYSQAKRLLSMLMKRGWIERSPINNKYKVNKENLKLRKIRKDEADDLYELMTLQCARAINAVKKKDGATYEEISHEVHGTMSTKSAVNALVEYKIIYLFEDKYFLCVSSLAAQVLYDVAYAKYDMSDKHSSDSIFEELEIKKKFGVLFE